MSAARCHHAAGRDRPKMYFSLDALKFYYRPYPIGLASPIADDATYQRLVAAFPPMDLFVGYEDMGKPGVKFTLSEKENPRQYKSFVQSSPIWRDFHRWIKSDDFIFGVLATLRNCHVDLGLEKYEKRRTYVQRTMRELRQNRLNFSTGGLASRFEFSALPASGGQLPPHTDAPSKIVTLVISMSDGSWNPSWGGGLEVNEPLRDEWVFNYHNRIASFDDMAVVRTFDYRPNRAVVFVKTYNSWHSIRPMTGPDPKALRRTLTVVIEDQE